MEFFLRVLVKWTYMQFHCFVFELRVDFICYNVAGIILQDERRLCKGLVWFYNGDLCSDQASRFLCGFIIKKNVYKGGINQTVPFETCILLFQSFLSFLFLFLFNLSLNIYSMFCQAWISSLFYYVILPSE